VSGALDGIRVLDLSRFVSGPMCTFFLASLGAEVIAVEPPEPTRSRRLAPLAHPDGGATTDYVDGAIAMPFLKRARGKRSVAIDITHPDGQRLLRKIAEQSDIVVENARPGGTAKFGLGYDDLRALNPRLVYVAISGYGQDGPDLPAMDNIVQAASGFMARTGFPDGPPLRAGTTIADHSTAMFAALGALAALRHRDATGAGQLVDVSMLDVLAAQVWDEPVDFYARTGRPLRSGNADARGAPINTYECADGWISVTCTSDRQWVALCERMGRPGLEREHADAAVAAWAKTRPVDDVERILLECRMPAGRVRDPLDALALAREDLLEDLRHPDAPEPSGFVGPRLPITFAGRVDLAPAEVLGASTEAVLRELAGADDETLARLRAAGVIA